MITTKPTIENKKPLALGFIGVGWIGRNRMEVLLKNANTSALMISEPSEENSVEALKVAESAMRTSSPSEVYENKELDGIVIATPSAMHAEQAIEALKSGKSVFCQKPLGRTASEVKEVVEAAKEADKLLAVDLSYRYTKAFKAIYNLIQSGEIGEIYAADLVFHNAYGPDKEWFYDIKKSGGGCVMDLGIHLIDLALWTLDFPEIKDVKSHLYHKGKKLTFFDEHVEDFASVSITSEKDTHINLECSWNVSAGQDAVIEARFYGTEGGAAFKNVNGSFYDFTAEKYKGTYAETLVSPPDDWSGRAGVVWAEALAEGQKFDQESAEEFIKTTKIIDRIYGR
ncbi:Gfo/Idh/MocA family oxidoreductase [Zunongwangia sp. F363]|uniref:Gfo/Idh/MocA family oxidoreductase n=1 Tax=Autumnicola tepida TaxID=3075595 RepID=A0ABU3CCH2_9FLAO|nr:Gfo/Idh/MocA family oxidoreductase [Zunongwangia sp. F363]MDT0643917.1 Gfo/Idh/MocA family oxidoreductase [Zunongwangia sp. F363]